MPISRPRSGAEIAGIPCGSSEKQIFGNCVLPENRANQILARLLLESRFLLLHESPVGGLQILLGIEFCPHSPFRQSDQGTAHGKMALSRDAPDCARERRGNGNALTDRLGPGGARRWLCSARHISMLADTAPVWCRLGQMPFRGRGCQNSSLASASSGAESATCTTRSSRPIRTDSSTLAVAGRRALEAIASETRARKLCSKRSAASGVRHRATSSSSVGSPGCTASVMYSVPRSRLFIFARLPSSGSALPPRTAIQMGSEERRVGKECRSRWS